MGKVLFWFKGLVAAAIGGAANTLSAIYVVPEIFNFSTPGGVEKLWQMALAGAVIGVVLYLKQRPIWPNGEKLS